VPNDPIAVAVVDGKPRVQPARRRKMLAEERRVARPPHELRITQAVDEDDHRTLGPPRRRSGADAYRIEPRLRATAGSTDESVPVA
jgi:hypothetical protein